jgi:hypothetical protein
MSETRRARLADGSAVDIEILLETREATARDLDLLPVFTAALEGHLSEAGVRSALLDAPRAFAQAYDTPIRLELVDAATRQTGGARGPAVPRPRRELCASRVFVTEVGGSGLSPADDPAWQPRDDEANARAVIQAFLHHALFAGIFPVLRPGERPCLVDGRLVAAGEIASLPSAAQRAITGQLLAAAADAPDEAWLALRAELSPAGQPPVPEEEVQRAFRRLAARGLHVPAVAARHRARLAACSAPVGVLPRSVRADDGRP